MEAMAKLEFILCADDYGMTEAVSRGLLEVAAAGRISAASAMASLPDWKRAARDWSASRPPVDLGLHVTLTVGAPLGAMPRPATIRRYGIDTSRKPAIRTVSASAGIHS